MRIARVPKELMLGPFTTAMAATFGVSKSALRSAPWHNLFRDVWVHEDVTVTKQVRFAAVRLILPAGTFVCGLTAAWLYGIDVQDRRDELIWIGCRTGRRLRVRTGCTVREITVDHSDLILVDGVWVTSPLRTVFDCGRWLSVVEGTVVADALSHADLVSEAELASYVRTHRGLRGVRRMDQLLELMDSRSESPMETRVRLLIVLNGLPAPEPQIVIQDLNGNFVARADLGYREQRFLIEYDGAFHWEQRRADDRRRDSMRDLGWRILVVSREDYYEYPETILAKVRAGLGC
jgi:hypothetical protein